MPMHKVGGLSPISDPRKSRRLEADDLHRTDFAGRRHGPDVTPKLHGHFRKTGHTTAMAEALRDVDPRYPRSYVYIDAIEKAFKEHQSHHETLLKNTIKGKDTEDALKDFDAEVEKIKKAGASRRQLHKDKTRRFQSKEREKGEDGTEEDPNFGLVDQGPCGVEELEDKKPKERLIYPQNCHPENVWLEFAPKKADYHAKGTAWADTDSALNSFKAGNRRLHAPGWLYDLSAAQIRAIHSIRDYLTDLERTDDITKVVDDLHIYMTQLGLPEITKPEITRVIRWLPAGKETGLDYTVFLLALGDFTFASLNHATRPYPRKLTCRDDQSDADLYASSEFDKEVMALFGPPNLNEFNSYFEIENFREPVYVEELPPYAIRGTGEYVPTGERDVMVNWRNRIIAQREKALREQHRWAEELHAERMRSFQKYREIYNRQLQEKKEREANELKRKEEEEAKKKETIKRLIEKYISEGIPPLTAQKKAISYVKRSEFKMAEKARTQDFNSYTRRQQILWTGLFLAEMYDAVDTIKPMVSSTSAPHKVAPKHPDLYKTWREDQIEKEAKNTSPYLEPLAFVTNRISHKLPKGCNDDDIKCAARGITTVEFDHWIMDLPLGGDGKIMLTENRYRLRQILESAFFKTGSAFCILPRVELMLHFAHNFVDQLLNRADHAMGGCPGKRVSRKSVAPRRSTITALKDSTPTPSVSRLDIKSASKEESEPDMPSEQKEQPLAPFRNPERDVVPDGCNPKAELPYRNICKNKTFKSPDLPEYFDGSESNWIRKFGESLFRPANSTRVRPTKDEVPFYRLGSVRQRVSAFHAEQWDAYNCRRYQLRKNLWENMNVERYANDLERNRFANTFWALLPHDNRIPLPLLNTNVERSLG